jgi:3-deoxy-D-manno-octulosonic-acid transferase
MIALYRRLAPLLAALLPLAAPFSAKLRRTLSWRRDCPPDPAALSLLSRRPTRYWIHAASAGELEQARPLLAGLHAREPEAGILLTLSSSSARRAGGEAVEAEIVLPLPADTPLAMAKLLDALRPTALIAVKWDLWPSLVSEAARRRVPVLLLGGVLSPDSGRARWPGRLLAAPTHRLLAGIGAASERDARVFGTLGIDPARLRVTGDTRFDRVLARLDEQREQPLTTRRDEGFCLVVGSSWPREEKIALDAFAELRAEHPGLRLLLVPHEPGERCLERLEGEAAARGLPLWRLSKRAELADGGVCVADRVGILPELYAPGSLAMVGGGFGRGVHSVLEPAAQGLPVITGPRIGRADEARRLAEAGGAFVVKNGDELLTLWRRCLEEPTFLSEAATAARRFVAAESGATARSLAWLDACLPDRSSSETP